MTNAVTWSKMGLPLRRTIAALAGSAVAISSMAPTLAIAQTNLPSGAQVSAGAIEIRQAGTTGLVLDQSSAAAIVNWDQFSIGTGHSVQVNNASGATLNRVTGASGTQIDGLLSATGSVFVINPNGVIIGKSGVVETGGAFVASTLDVTDSDFLDGGDLTFRGDSSAQIVNMGRISSLSSDVSLIAHTLRNEGEITALKGTVGLAAGREILLRDAATADGKLLVRIGSSDARIDEQGVIRAASVALKANGGNIYALAGNKGGSINATGISKSNGRIYLTAGAGSVTTSKPVTARRTGPARAAQTGGDIFINAEFASVGGALNVDGAEGGRVEITAASVSLAEPISARGLDGAGGAISVNSTGDMLIFPTGILDVSGAADGGDMRLVGAQTLTNSGTQLANGASGTGGSIDITSGAVRLLSPTMEASGYIGGGQIRVGGEYQGGAGLAVDDLPNAQKLAVTDATVIGANATGPHGDGGRIILWADQKATVLGDISAKPGAQSGQGGFIEVSALEDLSILTSAISAGQSGRGGTVLFDPKNIVIRDAAAFDQSQFILGNGYSAVQNTNFAPDAGDRFGWAVSRSLGRLVVGAPGDDGAGNNVSDAGAVYMFTFNDASLSGATLTGAIGHGYVGGNNVNMSSLQADDQFGWAVALEGQVLVVGVPGADSSTSSDQNVGAVHLFTFDDLGMTGGRLRKRISQNLNTGASVFESGLDAHDGFGSSVALRGDNGVYRVAVGAVGDDNAGGQNAGKVYVYTVKDKIVSNILRPLADIDLTHTLGDNTGSSKTLDYDTISVNLDALDHFGAAVALQDDLLLVGAGGDDGVENTLLNTGAVYAFDLGQNVHTGKIFRGATQRGDVRMGSLDINDRFGSSLAVDGSRILVGAPQDDGSGNTATNTGAVYTFSGLQGSDLTGLRTGIVLGSGYDDLTFERRKNVDVAGLSRDDGFGYAVALNGSQVTVGAWGDDGNTNSKAQSGKVFLFNIDQGDELYARQLGTLGEGAMGTASVNVSLDAGDMYGSALAMLGNSIVVGAMGDDGAGNTAQNVGAVYMYELVGPDARSPELRSIIGKGYSGGYNVAVAGLEAGDLFGSSVSMTAENLVVGATGDDGKTNTVQNAGAVYYFQRRPIGPKQWATIGSGYHSGFGRPHDENIDLQPVDSFGSSVALTDSMLYVGAEGDDGYQNRGTNSGAVYAFKIDKSSLLSFNKTSTIGYDYRQPIIKTTRFTGSNAALDPFDAFGSSLAIFGNNLAVGAVGDDGFSNTFSQSGAVHLFKVVSDSGDVVTSHAMIGRGYTEGNDVHIARLKQGNALGRSVALGEKMLVTGAPLTNGFAGSRTQTGAVYRIRFDTSTYLDGHLDGVLTYGATGTELAGGQNTAVFGLEAGDRLGRAVALDGNRLFASALNDGGIGNAKANAGRVYNFSLDAMGYQKSGFAGGLYQAKPLGAQLQAGDLFGSAVALQKNLLAIGAPSDDGASNHLENSGAVHLYSLSSSSDFSGLQLIATLGAGYTGGNNLNVANLDALDRFGASVALDNGRLAVGAVNDDGLNNVSHDTGAVYLFSYGHRSGSFLRRESVLGAGYGAFGGKNKSVTLDAGDKFGRSVAVDGRILVVGAPGDDGIVNRSTSRDNGAVHVFSMQSDLFAGISHATTYGAGYAQARKGQPTTGLTIGSAFDNLGMSVALSGDNLVIGAPGDDGKLNRVQNSGAVHMIRLPDDLTHTPTYLGTIGGGYSGANDIQVWGVNQSDLFGHAVALDGDQLVVGAPFHDGASGNAKDTGAMYRFAFADQNMSHGRLVSIIGKDHTGTPNSTGALNRNINLQGGDRFGSSVALHGARIVIGANGDDGSNNTASGIGRVYNVILSRTGSVGNPPKNASFGIAANQDFTISTEVLERLLSTGDDIHLKANNDIRIDGVISVRNENGNGGDFSLTAGRSVRIFQNVTTDNGNFTVLANAGAGQGVVTSQRDSGSAHLIVGRDDVINAGSGTIRLALGTGGTTGNLVLGVNSHLKAARVELLQSPTNTFGQAFFKSGSKITATSAVNSVVISAPFLSGTLNAVTPSAGRVIVYQANGNFSAASANMIYNKTLATLPVTALPASTGRVTVARNGQYTLQALPGNLVTGDDAQDENLSDTATSEPDFEENNPDLGDTGPLDPELQTSLEDEFDFSRYALPPLVVLETTKDPVPLDDRTTAAPQANQNATDTGANQRDFEQSTFRFITRTPRRNTFRSVRSRSVTVQGSRADRSARRTFLLCLGSARVCGEEGA